MQSRKTYVTSAKYRRSGDFSRILEDFMKRAFLAIFCGAALLANSIAYADAVSDRERAERYSQAAQSGDSEAQFYMGALYSSGVGRPRSDEEAFRWFSRAADQGHSHAMLVLAGLYAIGRGTSNDNLKAYKWAYIVSVGTRVEEFRNGARQLIGVLETRMTPAQVSRPRPKPAAGVRCELRQSPALRPTMSDRTASRRQRRLFRNNRRRLPPVQPIPSVLKGRAAVA